MDENKENLHGTPDNSGKLDRIMVFARSHLSLLIILAGTALILIFIIGSVTRAIQKGIYEHRITYASSSIAKSRQDELDEEESLLLEEAALLARHYDYAAAAKLLNSFSGDMLEHPKLLRKYEEYTAASHDVVLWSDPDTILHLSFQNLIADPDRAFSDARNGATFKSSYITTSEFTSILQQLYNNDYVLVRLSDITTSSGAKNLYLPAGKKPLVITQTSVNYYTFTLDSDGDKLPDAGGSGFASKLVLDANGYITCEMVDSSGNTVYGAYDLVPILDSFIETHPGFSYKGAKAVLAVTGYDGLFGYRTNPEAREHFGDAYYSNELEGASQIAQALRDSGYELACYTYGNEAYGALSAEQISDEMSRWITEVAPILGFTNVFVFAKKSDIGTNGKNYRTEKFDALYSAGFRYFIGFCESAEPWYSSHGNYVRQGRILVTGNDLLYSPRLYEGLFDTATVLDGAR